MGQYYTPVIIRGNSKKTFYSHDYDNGLKLMEHSYIGNDFVETVLQQLFDYPGRLAWVGDYAEPNDVENELAGKFIEIANGENEKKYRAKPEMRKPFENSFQAVFVNITKKQYIRIKNYVINNGLDKCGFVIHPIPLLTAIGNGKGGGDYWGLNKNLVGSWACDTIIMCTYLYDEYEKFTDITKDIAFEED